VGSIPTASTILLQGLAGPRGLLSACPTAPRPYPLDLLPAPGHAIPDAAAEPEWQRRGFGAGYSGGLRTLAMVASAPLVK